MYKNNAYYLQTNTHIKLKAGQQVEGKAYSGRTSVQGRLTRRVQYRQKWRKSARFSECAVYHTT